MPLLLEHPHVLHYTGPSDQAARELAELDIAVDVRWLQNERYGDVELLHPVWQGHELGDDMLTPGTVFVLQEIQDHDGSRVLLVFRPDGSMHFLSHRPEQPIA